jgi:hypothetical protein
MTLADLVPQRLIAIETTGAEPALASATEPALEGALTPS